MSSQSYPGLDIIRQTSGAIPRGPWRQIKEAVVGKDYHVSLVFPTLKLATDLHQQWKKKPGPANILSFELDDTAGEIFISLSQARRECKNYDRDYHNYLLFLFIHGLFHLKGYTHGSTMEKQEARIRQQFGV